MWSLAATSIFNQGPFPLRLVEIDVKPGDATNAPNPGAQGTVAEEPKRKTPRPVFERIAQQRSKGDALQAIAVMKQGLVVDLDTSTALRAAKLSLEHRLPLADSVILATAREYEATLWTQDADFQDLPDVEYRPPGL